MLSVPPTPSLAAPAPAPACVLPPSGAAALSATGATIGSGGCRAVQPLDQQIGQAGHDLAPGPGEGSAEGRQQRGAQRQRSGRGRRGSDENHLRLAPQHRHGCPVRRSDRASDQADGPGRAGANAGLTLSAQRIVDGCSAVHQVESSCRAHLDTGTAAGALPFADGDHVTYLPSGQLAQQGGELSGARIAGHLDFPRRYPGQGGHGVTDAECQVHGQRAPRR